MTVDVGTKWHHDGRLWLVVSTKPGGTADGSDSVRLIEIQEGREDAVSAKWLRENSRPAGEEP